MRWLASVVVVDICVGHHHGFEVPAGFQQDHFFHAATIQN
jgi:hypothetical protein